MRFRPEQHLRRQRDFRAVREQGRRVACGAFTLAWLQREQVAAASEVKAATTAKAPPVTARVGVVASTAAVGNAVARNRAKRRLRELFRRHQDLVPTDCDLVLTARSSLQQTDHAALDRKFVEACQAIARR